MMHITLVDSRNPSEAAWVASVAKALGELADVEIARVDVSRLASTARNATGAIVSVSCDEQSLHQIAALDADVVLAPAPDAADALRRVARFGKSRLRVLAFTAACHAVAQRAGLRSAYFQYFPDPLASTAKDASDAVPSVYSFLHRMARGDAVVESGPVASDSIVDGVNGFARVFEGGVSPQQADRMSHAARLTVAQGHARWRMDHDRLRDYLGSPPMDGTALRYAHTLAARSVQRTRSAHLPAVTVATVVRNAAADLRHTLQSVCGQRCPSFEIVVCDGGSTDGTLDVIAEFARHIDHWTSGPDGGPYDAMQKAAAVARGRRILFMNAGDRFVDDGALGRLVEAARDDADVVAGHHVYIDAHGIETVNHCVDFERTYARLRAGDLDSDWVRGAPCHQAVLTRTELIHRHRFDPSYRIAADHEFMYRMRGRGAMFQVVPTIVAEYVGGGLSARQQFRCLEEWRRIAHAHSRDQRRADRSLDRLVFMAMKAHRRKGPFDFSQEPARSRPLLAALIDIRHRIKDVLRFRPGKRE
jgi:GT2 family glycosyltransferase